MQVYHDYEHAKWKEIFFLNFNKNSLFIRRFRTCIRCTYSFPQWVECANQTIKQNIFAVYATETL